MKALIIGYITATINHYTRSIETLKECKASDGSVRRFETIREELNDLLDYVEDIPEEIKEPITVVFSNNDELDKLKKYIRELEDKCENSEAMNKNLNKQVLELRDNNRAWQEACIMLREKVDSLEGKR